MIEKKDIEKLAALARITVPEGEIEKIREDIGAILDYVSQINDANLSAGPRAGGVGGAGVDGGAGGGGYNSGVKNVLREDGVPHESGKFTEALLAQAPKTEKGYIKVKKILQ